jgi:hypothetical protein
MRIFRRINRQHGFSYSSEYLGIAAPRAAPHEPEFAITHYLSWGTLLQLLQAVSALALAFGLAAPEGLYPRRYI